MLIESLPPPLRDLTAVLSRLTRSSVRLAPELDDEVLGKTLQNPARTRGRHPAIAQMHHLLRSTGSDWERRCHRVRVLAKAFPMSAHNWQQLHPDNSHALTARSWTVLLTARSTGRAAAAEEALALCRKAASAWTEDPTPWVAMLGSLRTLARPDREISAVRAEIGRRSRWHRRAYLEILGYLSPEEQGSLGALRDLIDDLRTTMPPGAPAACLPVEAAVRQSHRERSVRGLQGRGAGLCWSQPHILELLDHTTQRWLRPGFLRHASAVADINLLAYALVQARRSREAATALHGASGLATKWPWRYDGDPIELCTRHRK